MPKKLRRSNAAKSKSSATARDLLFNADMRNGFHSNPSNVGVYQESYNSLTSLFSQGLLVLGGLLLLLVVSGGNPEGILLNLFFIFGVVTVACIEKNRSIKKLNTNKNLGNNNEIQFNTEKLVVSNRSLEEILTKQFQCLSDKDRNWMIKFGEKKNIGKECVLIQEGSRIENLYIALDGVFEVSSTSLGLETKITTLFDGEIIGEMSFATKQSKANATVKAIEQSNVWLISREILDEKILEDRDFAARFYEEIAFILSRRMSDCNRINSNMDKVNRVYSFSDRIFSRLTGNYRSSHPKPYGYSSHRSPEISLGMAIFMCDQEYQQIYY